MKTVDIVRLRLHNQEITQTRFSRPEEVVSWLGAMQAQEYAQAKWAIGLRLPGVKEIDVEKAIASGKILRTHMLRPTWHFVSPADIRWMLALTGPRVKAISVSIIRKEGLDAKVLAKANDVIAKALEGGKQLQRSELKTILRKKKIDATGLRLGLIMMNAELDAVVCGGARQGKQFTYALLDEVAPPVKKLAEDEAIAKMAEVYFRGRGPATIQDYVWWSGLTVKQAKQGIDALGNEFVKEVIEGKEHWFPQDGEVPKSELGKATFLMPDYDEYGISYKDRSALEDPKAKPVKSLNFNRLVIVDGRAAGFWKPLVNGKKVDVGMELFAPLSKTKEQALKAAVDRYLEFMKQEI
jgi:hypothetical protein